MRLRWGLWFRDVVVWLARPSHLIAGALRAGRDGLAAATISSHLFSTNQMLLAGIPANSIHSLRELSRAPFNFGQWISFWLDIEPPDTEIRRGLQWARFELERTHEQKKPYLAKRTSWR